MRIKGTMLVVVITCMGTALAMAISGQDGAPAEVVGAVTKDSHSRTSQPGAEQHEQSQPDHFDLSAIKRTVPDHIQNSGLFQSKSWYRPPPSPPSPPPKVSSLPPPPPPPAPGAPQIPFTFIGRLIDGNDVTLYLSRNNQQYSAKLSDVLDGTYKVEKITDKSVVLTYLPLNIQQELVFNSTAVGVSALSVSESSALMQPTSQPLQADLPR